MDGNFLGKSRKGTKEKCVWLFVLTLMAVFFVAISSNAFAACPGGNGGNGGNGNGGNGNGGNGNGGNGNGGIGASTRRGRNVGRSATATATTTNTRTTISAETNLNSTTLRQLTFILEKNTLQFVDSTGNVVDFGTLQAGQTFEITASDTTTNVTQNLPAKLLGNHIALVTLPSSAIPQEILFADLKSPCLSSRTFPINLGGTTQQTAHCLDKNSASVALPSQSFAAIMVFPQAPIL